MRYQEHKAELLKNEEFKRAYDEMAPVYDIVRQLVAYRIQKGMTQKELADKIGTKQSSISRFESSMNLPSLSFLNNIADALELKWRINFQPK